MADEMAAFILGDRLGQEILGALGFDQEQIKKIAKIEFVCEPGKPAYLVIHEYVDAARTKALIKEMGKYMIAMPRETDG